MTARIRSSFLVLLFFCSHGLAIPSVPLSDSLLECAGGWGANFVYFRTSPSQKQLLKPSEVSALLNGAERKARRNIKKLQNALSRANDSMKRRIRKAIKIERLKLLRIADHKRLVLNCYSGSIVASSPLTASGSGVIPSWSYPAYAGSPIYAADGRYLGILSSNNFHPDSISNEFGLYGSPLSVTSMFNKLSQYGGRFSLLSPFNQYSVNAPIVYLNAQPVAYISINEFIPGARIDTAELFVYLGREDDIP